MHKTQAEARNGTGSYYFRGDVIYSYGSHFPIASHVTNTKGEQAVLFTTKGYSSTTNMHKSLVHRSIPPNTTVFTVPNMHFSFSEAEDKYQHERNLRHYTDDISTHLSKCARAISSYNKEWRLKRAIELREEVLAYCVFFGLPDPEIEAIPELDSEKMAAIRKREAKASAAKAAEAKRRSEEQRVRALSLAGEWKAGGSYSYLLHVLPTMLRIVGSEVETSRGARFPITHAQRGLKLVRAVMARGEEWLSNGHSIHLGPYQLTKIEADGTCHAGCHIVTWPEIDRIAADVESYKGDDEPDGESAGS